MKRLGNQVFSYLLLLCIAVSTFPWNLLHHHQEEISCENLDEFLENDICHQNVFHSNQFLEIQCDHETHIDRGHIHCEFCKFITSRHNNYVVPYHYTFHQFDVLEETVYFEFPFSASSAPDVIYNRGPPA